MARVSETIQPVGEPVRPEINLDIEHDHRSNSGHWHFFGRTTPRSEIVFFVQILLVYIIVIVSIVNLTIGSASEKLWISLLCSSIGYVLPSPSLKIKHHA